MNGWDNNFIGILIQGLVGPLVAGLVIWFVGKRDFEKRTKNEAIRDLMTFRGDYASSEFRRSLNKVSITFHKDKETRKQISNLYEQINDPNQSPANIKRKIVGLIYNLCQKNGFKGITEYDIDQAFIEGTQAPIADTSPQPTSKTTKTKKRVSKKKKR
ncbi:hypothetical protein HYU45_02970 [Candidatus Daviesbacteria bacterium]|nr:hypothetical protein [Candidatus Daviesbacteria bacterium]